jgi:hypothetical protein
VTGSRGGEKARVHFEVDEEESDELSDDERRRWEGGGENGSSW